MLSRAFDETFLVPLLIFSRCMGKGLRSDPVVPLLNIMWGWKVIIPHPSKKARSFNFDL